MAVKDKFIEAWSGKNKIVLERDLKAEEAMYQQQQRLHKKQLDEIEREEADHRRRMEDAKIAGNKKLMKQEFALLQQTMNKKEALQKQQEDESLKNEANMLRISAERQLNSFKSLTVAQRRIKAKEVADNLKQTIDSEQSKVDATVKLAHKLKKQLEEARGDKEKEAAIQKEIALNNEAHDIAVKNVEDLSAKKKIADKNARGLAGKIALVAGADSDKRQQKGQEVGTKFKEQGGLASLKRQVTEEKDYQKEQSKLRKQLADAKKRGIQSEIEAAEQAIKDSEEAHKKEKENQVTLGNMASELGKEVATGVATAVSNVVDNLTDKLTDVDSISKVLDDVLGDQDKNMARLQGSMIDWREKVDDVSDAIGFSGIVSKRSVISKMSELVDTGVAYNLELRAFISEASQSIASTFDAFDSNLMRMIRLQQADTTAARLGLEATLTKLFNEKFKDTSYLTKGGASDAVAQALMDSSAMMSKESSLVYEYTVQKWLGSLYSLGASDSVVNTIAQGLNYLGTGNVSALNSNSALQTLFAMSASRVSGGKSYADMLNQGLTAEDTNKLLKAMVEYLAEIADSQTNMVTKSAYADLFGMSITDLSTFASITQQEINSLFETTANYNGFLNETETQLKQIKKRKSLSEMVDTAVDNALVGVATNIGSNAVTYGTWKALEVLQQYVGEVNIPSVLAAGFGLAADIDLIKTAQSTITGFSLVTDLIKGIKDLVKGNGPTKLSQWNMEEYTERGEGSGIKALAEGTSAGTSYSAKFGVAPSATSPKSSNMFDLIQQQVKEEELSVGTGNYSSSDIETVSLTSATDKAYENSGVSSQELQEERELTRDIYNALAGDSTPNIITLLTSISSQIDTSNNSLRLLSEIEDAVDKIQVLYTSINSTAYYGHNYSAVSTLSSEVAALQSTTPTTTAVSSSAETKETTSNSESLNGSGKIEESINRDNLAEIIATAVAEGIRQYSFANKMPVEMTYTGGNF